MQRLVITGSVLGQDLLYSASSGEYVKVMAYRLSSGGGASYCHFGSNGSNLSGDIALGSGSNVSEWHDQGLFETSRGQNLTLTSSGSAGARGHVMYKVLS